MSKLNKIQRNLVLVVNHLEMVDLLHTIDRYLMIAIEDYYIHIYKRMMRFLRDFLGGIVHYTEDKLYSGYILQEWFQVLQYIFEYVTNETLFK